MNEIKMSGEIVINEKGVRVPDTEEVYNRIVEEWNNIFEGKMQKEPSTPQGQMITSLVKEIDNKNNLLNYFINQINPKLNEGIWQEAIASIFFLTRKGAESSIVTCQCRGLAGVVIPSKSLVKSTNGDYFEAVGDIVININGVTDGVFRSVEKGLIPVLENTINKIVSVVSGWDSVNNSTSGSLGRLEESALELEKRREQSIAKNGKGTIASLYGRIGEIKDVLSVYCVSNRNSQDVVIDEVTIKAHSVYCCVLGGLSKDIAEVIENTIGAGDGTSGNTSYSVLIEENNILDVVNFQRPEPFDCEITINLKNTPTTPFGIEATIKDIIHNDFYGISGDNARVGIGETVYASRFFKGVAGISGLSLISIKINKVGEEKGDFIYIPINAYGVLDKNKIIVNIEV